MDKKRILIVDDEEPILHVLKKSLRSLGDGYAVDTAVNGFSAMAYLNDRAFDLVITDYHMDGMDGLELINNINADWPDTRVILITAYGNDRLEADAKGLNVYRYILKPLDIPTFRTIVTDALSDHDSSGSGMGLLVLSDTRYREIMTMLEQLQLDVGGRCIILTDNNGQVIANAGDVGRVPIEEISSLLSGGMATLQAAGEALDGDTKAINLSYRESEHDNLYGINIGQQLMLIVIIESGKYSSRLGTTWYYARQTAVSLRKLIAQVDHQASPKILKANMDEALDDEFDKLFGSTDELSEDSLFG